MERMSIIETASDSEVTGLAAELYAEDIEDIGYVPSHTRVLAINPEAYRAFEALMVAIARPMDKRRYELVTLAAALGTKSQHCRLAHGAKSLKYMDEDTIVSASADYHSSTDLTPAEVAMMEFAERVSNDSYAMTDADSLRLREHGFSDREIVDITLAAAGRNYLSRAIQALAVDVDVPPVLNERLRNALLTGI
jgi:uncharacterized peroxidase-related enzyme